MLDRKTSGAIDADLSFIENPMTENSVDEKNHF